MKSSLALFIFLMLAVSSVHGTEDIAAFMENLEKESLEFNKTVTDKEILDYMLFLNEIGAGLMQKEIANNPEELKRFIDGYRQVHNEAGMRLPTLRGMSEDELEQLRAIHRYKKQEYYEAFVASKKIDGLTNSQLVTILSAGQKLIESYDSIPPTPEFHTTAITEEFPKELDFLNLKLIYLYENSCTLFLQKGIGKGVGLDVVNNNGEWKLESFDEYKSWDRHEIEIQ